MQKKNIKTIITWRNWLIKKLLTKETSKEDILNFIAKEEKEIISIEDNQIFEDNNEKILTLYNLNFDSCLHKLIFPSQNISIAIINASGFFLARNNVFSPLPDPTSIIFFLFFFISDPKLIV